MEIKRLPDTRVRAPARQRLPPAKRLSQGGGPLPRREGAQSPEARKISGLLSGLRRSRSAVERNRRRRPLPMRYGTELRLGTVSSLVSVTCRRLGCAPPVQRKTSVLPSAFFPTRSALERNATRLP